MAHQRSLLSKGRYLDAHQELEEVDHRTSDFWLHVASSHHEYGEWQEAQAAAAIALVHTAKEST